MSDVSDPAGSSGTNTVADSISSLSPDDDAAESFPQSATARLLLKMGIPARGLAYFKSPAKTFHYMSLWLNGKWQLRRCTSVGRWTCVSGKVFVQNEGRIVFGKLVYVSSRYAHSVFATFPGGSIEIGDRTVLNYGVDIAATEMVRIGDDCLIGTHVIILDNDFHDLKDRKRRPEPKPVLIGNNVWIGNRATILPGVTIGDGSAVGAGSVVMTDIPPRSLAMGNPARVIKQF